MGFARRIDHVAAGDAEPITLAIEAGNDAVFVGNFEEAEAQHVRRTGGLLIRRSAMSETGLRACRNRQSHHQSSAEKHGNLSYAFHEELPYQAYGDRLVDQWTEVKL